MTEIDEKRLQLLMELVLKANPEMDQYVVWVLCVNQLFNEQGIYGNVKIAEQIRQQ